MIKRRDFLKMIGGIGAYVLMPFSKIAHLFPSTYFQQNLEKWELYEGFLFLELDAPKPDFVTGAACPILGDLSVSDKNNPTVSKFRGKSVRFDEINSLKEKIKFPHYIPGSISDKLKFQDAFITIFEESGEVWEAIINYGVEGIGDPLVCISARTMFSHPYPVWPLIAYPNKDPKEYILDEEYFVRKPEKIDFTPQAGIMITTNEGYTLQWIKQDILYSLSVVYAEWLDKAATVGKSLIEI